MKSYSVAVLAISLLGLNSIAWSQFQQQEDGQKNGPGKVYAIPGNCSSQGDWTQNALSQTSRLKDILHQLKENPACKGYAEKATNALNLLQNQVQDVENMAGNSGAANMIAARNLMQQGSPLTAQATQLLMSSSLYEKAKSIGGKSPVNYENAKLATKMGLGMLNSTIDSFAQAREGCLDAQVGVSVAAGLTKTLAAFVSSGHSPVSDEFTTAIQKLGTYLTRDSGYIEEIRKLNDREFITSMSCLLEVTSESFCNARDAYKLMEDLLRSQKVAKKKITFKDQATGNIRTDTVIVGENESLKKANLKGPLAAYYILSRQVPVVTNWIQKVQYGNTPQLPTEAQFQVAVIQNVQNMQIAMKTIEGNFNLQLGMMRDPKLDQAAKQGYLLNLVESVASNLNGGGGLNRGETSENFFMKGLTFNELVFKFLLGIDVPDSVLGRGPEAVQFSNRPSDYLQARYRQMPEFQNPEERATKIADNLRGLFDRASKLADAYYMKYFIVDKMQVVQDSLIGMDTNVREALANIDVYLKDLEQRLVQAPNQEHATTILHIKDTRARIGRVLARYIALHTYGKSILASKTLNEVEMSKQLEKLGYALLQQVYLEFQVMLARAGWLENRLMGFVLYDYTVSVRTRQDFNPYINDLLITSGYKILTDMFTMTEIPYTRVTTDLNRAMNIYSTNIDSIEKTVQQVYKRQLNELRDQTSNKPLTLADRYWKGQKESFLQGFTNIPGDDDSNLIGRSIRGLGNYLAHSFLGISDQPKVSTIQSTYFPFFSIFNFITGRESDPITRMTNEFNTAGKERDLLCTQILAFTNLRPYWFLCKDSNLRTPLMASDVNDKELLSQMDSYLSVPFTRKAWESIAGKDFNPTAKSDELGGEAYQRRLNLSNRVCALRDFHRRNEVVRVTSAMRELGPEYANEFTKIVEENIVEVPAEKPALQEEPDKSQVKFEQKHKLKKNENKLTDKTERSKQP